ncbi:MAG: hypothetical protein N4A54_12405 [Peptostreptococcaceae bacterium]|jgi:hypothetical protein|nr:hypothetical protein [Peptostreptococcaceae bacterium]
MNKFTSFLVIILILSNIAFSHAMDLDNYKNIENEIEQKLIKEKDLEHIEFEDRGFTKEHFFMHMGIAKKPQFIAEDMVKAPNLKDNDIVVDDVIIKNIKFYPYSKDVYYYGDKTVYTQWSNLNKCGYFTFDVTPLNEDSVRNKHSFQIHMINKKGEEFTVNSNGAGTDYEDKTLQKALKTHPNMPVTYKDIEVDKNCTFVFDENKDIEGLPQFPFKDMDKIYLYSRQSKEGTVIEIDIKDVEVIR